MSKRLLAILLLTFMPLAAFADNTAPDASGLGPAATTNSEGSSSADSGALQPAGIAPLQSTTGDATGLAAPNANTLQTPVSGSDALKVLADNADGSSTSLADDDAAPNYWGWLWASLLIAVLVGCAVLVVRDRRRFAGHPADAEPSASEDFVVEQSADPDSDPDIEPEDSGANAEQPASLETEVPANVPEEAALAEAVRPKHTHHAKRRKH